MQKMGLVKKFAAAAALAATLPLAAVAAMAPEANALDRDSTTYWHDSKTNSIVRVWRCQQKNSDGSLAFDKKGQAIPSVCMVTHSVDPTNKEMIDKVKEQLDIKNPRPEDAYRFCGWGPRFFSVKETRAPQGDENIGKLEGQFRVDFDSLKGKRPHESATINVELEDVAGGLRVEGWWKIFRGFPGLSGEYTLKQITDPPPACHPPVPVIKAAP